MDNDLYSLVLVPMVLGLLGFFEPCTMGAHLLFLDTLVRNARTRILNATMIFAMTRMTVMGLFGALIAALGQTLIGVQTSLWLVFGLIYLAIGLVYLTGLWRPVGRSIRLAPAAWTTTRNPAVLGLVFGLNIPACAAPILFAIIGLSASTGTAVAGLAMMTVFGLFLSAPLILLALMPARKRWLEVLSVKLKSARWPVGTMFVLLGLWAIWFGLYVDPVDWSVL